MRLAQTLLNGVKAGTPPPPPWRDAATLIVATTGPGGVDYLVTQRSPHSALLPNGICFPGGAVSTADTNSGWIDHFSRAGLNLSSLSFLAPNAHRPPIYRDGKVKANEIRGLSKEIVLRITAIRETFEECGFLICLDPPGPIGNLGEEEVRGWQKRVKKEPHDFLTLCQEMKVVPDLWCLREWSNWLTPTFAPPKYRFDAMFYLAILREPPRVLIDPKEVAGYFTASARKMVDEGWKLPGPQLYELSRMRGISDLETLETLAKLRQTKGLERWFPILSKAKDGVGLILPGDDLYPEDPKMHEYEEINRPDSTFAQLKESTKNHNRMQSIPDKEPECIINIPHKYGGAYDLY